MQMQNRTHYTTQLEVALDASLHQQRNDDATASYTRFYCNVGKSPQRGLAELIPPGDGDTVSPWVGSVKPSNFQQMSL